MRPNTSRLFALILVAQTLCLTVGLGFYHLYISSVLVQAEEDEVRLELADELKAATAAVNQQSFAVLERDRQSWDALVNKWRATARATDHLYLLTPQGRVVAEAASKASTPAANVSEAPLRLVRATSEWGRFGAPIRGMLKQPGCRDLVALAEGLSRNDGYVMVTRLADAERIEPSIVRQAMWAAGGITLLWTMALLAATLYMILSYYKQNLSRDVVRPEVEALKQAQALVRTQETVIFGLAKLSDSRDADTGSHLERIAHYSVALAAALRQRPEFREQITPGFVQLIGISSALHDIGKVGVEDSILRKPGTLTPDERKRMQKHTKIGEDCLKEIERRLGSSNFLQMAREISSAHHERWDGQGYPIGLAGEQIPLSARIVALADVYDALSRKRVYKDALSHEQCVKMISEESGTHFDPRVVEAFLQIEDRFCQIAQQFYSPPSGSDAPDAETSTGVAEGMDPYLSLDLGWAPFDAQKSSLQ